MNPNPPPEGRRFTSNYQPIGAGRKPSKFKKFLKDNNIGAKDIQLVMKNVLSMDEDSLRGLIADTSKPMLLRVCIRAFLEDFKRGSLVNSFQMIERVFGKMPESVDLQADVRKTDMTAEEQKKLLNEYVKAYIENNPGVVNGTEND